MKDEALKLALSCIRSSAEYKRGNATFIEAAEDVEQALAAPVQEPVAWMFQHEETGRTMCVDAQQVEWGFEKGNPRLKKIAPLYTTPPAAQQSDVDAMIALARADEREACAKVCDDAFSSIHAGRVVCDNLAYAIRARGTHDTK